MKKLLVSSSESDYDINDYDDTDSECNEDSYDEDSDTDTETNSETNSEYESETDNETEINKPERKKEFNQAVNKQNNVVLPNNFKPKNGQVYIKPVQTNGQNKGNVNNVIIRMPQKNIQLKHKNKIKTVNTQTSKLLNMLVASYNKQQIKK